LADIDRVARATGREAQAATIIAGLQARVDAVVTKAAAATQKPRVLHLEWTEPLMCGGHWVPEMVEMAGGINCFGSKDQGSFGLDWAGVVASQPEIILLMPCGFEVTRALKDLTLLIAQPDWSSLPAVQQQRVYAVDASAYTSRSGPRLVVGLEIFAELLHPDLFTGQIPPQGAVRVPAEQLLARPVSS
jgi:iron complex transport system substrate-binding protein